MIIMTRRVFLLSAIALMLALMSLDLVASTCDASNFCCDSSSTYTVPSEVQSYFLSCCIQPADGASSIFTSGDCPTQFPDSGGSGSSIQCCSSASHGIPTHVSSCSGSTCGTSLWSLCGCDHSATDCSIPGFDTKLSVRCIL